jgi:hypothetical protein
LDSPLSSRMLRVSLAPTNFEADFREERPTSRVVDSYPVENTAVVLIPACILQMQVETFNRNTIFHSTGANAESKWLVIFPEQAQK